MNTNIYLTGLKIIFKYIIHWKLMYMDWNIKLLVFTLMLSLLHITSKINMHMRIS